MTDDVKRFTKLKKTIVDTGDGRAILECEGARFFKQFVILKFKDHDTVESIEKYCKKGIFVERPDAVETGPDEYFVADLIGIKVTDDTGNVTGTITYVISTGANDVYDISLCDGRRLLLPAIKQCVLKVDVDKGQMLIHVLDGLLE